MVAVKNQSFSGVKNPQNHLDNKNGRDGDGFCFQQLSALARQGSSYYKKEEERDKKRQEEAGNGCE